MINLSQVSLLNLLPNHLREDKNVVTMCKALDEEIKEINSVIPMLSYIQNMESLDDEMLDYLAWQYHVDFYDTSLEISKKIELNRNSIRWHKKKGTPSSVEELITTVFGDGYIEEWFEYNGEPYTFNVVTTNADVTNTKANDFQLALNSVKNSRSHLDNIIIRKTNNMSLSIGAIVHTGDLMVLHQIN